MVWDSNSVIHIGHNQFTRASFPRKGRQGVRCAIVAKVGLVCALVDSIWTIFNAMLLRVHHFLSARSLTHGTYIYRVG